MLSYLAILSLISLAIAAPATRQFPTGLTISPGSRTNLCLSVPGVVGNGSPVIASPCAAPQGPNKWDIIRGNSLVRLSGTTFCFDAGVNPRNNVGLKIYTCYPGLFQQQWYYTDDNRIAITGGDQCLDLGPSGPQTYQCITGNTNQVWVTNVPTPPPASSSSSSASSSSASPTPSNPVIRGVRIHPFGDTTRCLSLSVRAASNGVILNAGGCQSDPNFEQYQRWEITRGNGLVRLLGSNFCLDAGSSPAPGVALKIWQCYPGLAAQQWYYTADNHIAITGGTQCADVSGFQPIEQFCSGSAPGQVWTTTA